jgi:hypothetical protein
LGWNQRASGKSSCLAGSPRSPATKKNEGFQVNDETRHYGTRPVPLLIREIQGHRQLIRASGDPRLEASWDKIEQFVDFLYAEVGQREAPQDQSISSQAA